MDTSGFAALFLLLPLFLVRQRFAQLPAKGRAVIFFAAIGLGFMLLEIALIQKLTLFLGYPTYTLSVTLFSLLVFTGLGSALSERAIESRDRVLPVLAAVVVVLSLFFAFGLDGVVRALMGIPLAARIAVAAGLLAPLGLVLGAFMPLGLVTVSRLTPQASDIIAWGWAINGIFSVIASLLATMLSMTYGFRVVILIATVLYLAAAAALRSIPLRPNPD